MWPLIGRRQLKQTPCPNKVPRARFRLRPLRPLRMLAILIAEVAEVGDLNRGGRSAGDRDRGIRPSRGVRRL